MSRRLAVWAVFPLLAALCACQSDRSNPPLPDSRPLPMAPAVAPEADSRRLPLQPYSLSAPSGSADLGTEQSRPDLLTRAYASEREKIVEARATDPDGYKPYGSESLDSARAKCEEMSRRAAARGVRVLVVAFEGLASYDSPGTSDAYRYQVRIAAGDRRAQTPGFDPIPVIGGGYVLHELIMPLVERFGGAFEFLVYRHFEQSEDGDSVASVCARTWMSGAPGRRLIVIGHSMGGRSASLLARSLARARLWVDLLVTIDAMPSPPAARAGNVRRWENYFNGGANVPDADINQPISTDHLDIPGNPAIVGSVGRQLGAMIEGS